MIGRSADVWFDRYGLPWIACGTGAGRRQRVCIAHPAPDFNRPSAGAKIVAPKRQSLSFQTGLTMLSNP